MTNTPVTIEPSSEPTPTLLQRIAPPLFSFSAVLFCALAASQVLLLPKITTFRVGDIDVTVDEAIAYERRIRAEVLSLEDERKRLVLPYIDDTHDALMRRKRSTPSVVDVRLRLESVLRKVVESAGAEVRVDAVHIDTDTRIVTVRGAVDDAKPSSMAILSSAIDAVRALPDVADLVPPTMTREERPDGGYRSPFTFTYHMLP
jgi:hypothetical protein